MVRRSDDHRLVVVARIQGGIGALAAFSAGRLAVFPVRDGMLAGHRRRQAGRSD